MALPKAEQGRRAIIGYAQSKGWQVYRAVAATTEKPLPTSIMLMYDASTLLHVDVVPDRMDGDSDEQARLAAAGIKSYVVHSPSEIVQFCFDLGDIATTKRAS